LTTLDLQTSNESREALEGRRCDASLSTRDPRRGAGALWIVAAFALVAIAALAWWTTRERTPADAATIVEPARDHEPRGYLDPEPLARREESPEAPAIAPPPAYPAELFDPARYQGTARVEAHIRMSSGGPPPERWTLAFAPSPVMTGGKHAVAREVEVEGGAFQVAVDDVQLGSYTVRVLAEGLQSAPQQLELAKSDALDQLDEVVVFPLYAPGYLTGRVVDAASRPVEGIAVTLEALPSLVWAGDVAREPRELVTDASGTYTADALFDGDYRVFVGPRETPLAAFDDVSFAAPTLHMPDLVTPPLGELALLVRDRTGEAIRGATIEGLGLRSGPFRVTTDMEGRVRVPRCSAGTVHLYAMHEQVGAGEIEIEFDPLAEPEEHEIVIGQT
jgi:hypothetical protein